MSAEHIKLIDHHPTTVECSRASDFPQSPLAHVISGREKLLEKGCLIFNEYCQFILRLVLFECYSRCVYLREKKSVRKFAKNVDFRSLKKVIFTISRGSSSQKKIKLQCLSDEQKIFKKKLLIKITLLMLADSWLTMLLPILARRMASVG